MKRTWRKCVGVGLVFIAPLFTLAQSKPNIVFIMADDLGSSELGSDGSTFNETPHLDHLAANGKKFTQAYAAAPVCSPTRASIMTGQYPARVRITDFLGGSPDRFLDPAKYTTINEALSKEGYHTGIVGKWHLDTDYKNHKAGPKHHGFDEVIGTETKYIAGGDYFFPYDKISGYKEGGSEEYLTDRQNMDACNFIRKNKDKPFFLYLSYYSVHTRLAAPKETTKKYIKKFDKKYGAGSAERIFSKNSYHEVKHLDNPYLAAMLEHIDNGVGMVKATLDELGLAENTIIVFTSDNGGAPNVANNGNLRAHKSWLYEGGIRVPLLISWPSHIKAGEIKQPVSSIDFYPTFVSAAGGDIKQYPLDGENLMPLLNNNGIKRSELYWHYPAETLKPAEKMATVVRKDNYKLIKFYLDNRYELYNLKKDPSEKNNLVAKKQGKLKKLSMLMEEWKKAVNAEDPDPEALKKAKGSVQSSASQQNKTNHEQLKISNPGYKNPLQVKFGDPYIMYDEQSQIYYMYGTNGGAKDGFAAYSSSDLVNWKNEGQVYFGNRPDTWGIHSFWAPEVYAVKGKYYMFYSAQWRYNPTNELENFKIGIAVSDKPTGPFKDVSDKPLFDPGYPVIDANVFFDDDGKAYLYYSRCCYKHPVKSEIATLAKEKGWFNEIEESWVYGVELKPDFSEVIGEPVLILRPPVSLKDTQAEWESRSVTSREVNRRWTEGSYTFKKDGIYYIMYSANHFGGEHYAVGYATASTPLGPYKKAANNPVLQKNTSEGGDVTGTGHNSIAYSPDGKQMFCVYHGRTTETGKDRVVFIDKMEAKNGIITVFGPTTKLQPMPLLK